ncbi:helix-turn-helix transcriptional regulator [Polycyclovorans algicola]|uniref:helix-turn-helix transcriptional regulator n=1 Tax=Polycyclovorans algicola TaxID=616992 RepID=UPI0006937A6A|nr:WYL domain-containing protein [Polycyclovorans algicola]
MRYEKAEVMLQIAMDMQGRSQGLSLQDIAEGYSDEPISRRTAERLRDAVLRVFPDQVEELVGANNTKRWRIRSSWLRGLYQIDPVMLASLETGRKLLEQEGLVDQAQNLERLRGLLNSLLQPEQQRALEPQVEALTIAEGLALRPGPRVRVSTDALAVIREALQQQRVVRVQYRYRKTNVLRTYDLHPYGLLYGHRHYLVGSRTPGGAPKYFILGRIEHAELLRHAVIKPAKFNLQRHADRAFGIWQEDAVNVHWRFKPEAAEDAAEFIFHPTQVTEWGDDGSLHVRFRCGGIQEMDWHLYTWGDSVEVVEPAELRRRHGSAIHTRTPADAPTDL